MAVSGKIHGRFAAGILSGYDISSDATSIELSSATQMAKSTGCNGSTDETFTIGQNDNKVTLKGWFDDTADTGIYTALAALRDTSFVATFLPAGDASQGYVALMCQTEIPSDLKISSPVAATVALDANFQISGVLDTGVILVPRQQITGTGAAVVIGSALDNGASSANGAKAHFHITVAPSGGGTLSPFVVQTSPDNAVWTTVMTSGLAGTAIGADRQTVAGTVNRYVRVQATLTSTDTATIAVAFMRN